MQPGIKVRGREYLRIIYGPDYTDSLDVLRQRHLGKKRQLALREHGLGLEGAPGGVRSPRARVRARGPATLTASRDQVPTTMRVWTPEWITEQTVDEGAEA